MPPSDSKHPTFTKVEWDTAMRFPTDVATRDRLTMRAYAHTRKRGGSTLDAFENAWAQFCELATSAEIESFPDKRGGASPNFIFWLTNLVRKYNK